MTTAQIPSFMTVAYFQRHFQTLPGVGRRRGIVRDAVRNIR